MRERERGRERERERYLAVAPASCDRSNLQLKKRVPVTRTQESARDVPTRDMDISDVLLLTTLILTSASARKYTLKAQILFVWQYN